MLKIKDIPFFSKLNQDNLKSLGKYIAEDFYPKGSVLVQEGAINKNLVAVVSGKLKLTLSSKIHASKSDIFLSPGSVIGEMALMTDLPATFTLQAEEDTTLYTLSHDQFKAIQELDSTLYDALLEIIVNRISDKSILEIKRFRPNCVFLTYVRGEKEAEFHNIAKNIFGGIKHYASKSVFINLETKADRDFRENEFFNLSEAFKNVFSQVFGMQKNIDFSKDECKVDLEDSELIDVITKWREEGDVNHSLVFWINYERLLRIKNLLREQDSILLFTSKNNHKNYNRLLKFGSAKYTCLNIGDLPEYDPDYYWSYSLSDEECQSWEQHYESFLTKPRSIPKLDRMIRWLINKEIGLTLGAGAARGFAHLGILEVLEEAGIPIDYVSGCSMGGVIALVYALHGNAKKTIEVMRESVGATNKVTDISFFPRSSIFAGKKIFNAAKSVFGDKSFYDLTRPCSVVAADIGNSEKYIFYRGKLLDAVLSTSAIPGIFPPVLTSNQILVDGALISKVPVELLEERACGLKISVNAATTQGWYKDTDVVEYHKKNVSRFMSFTNIINFSWDLLSWFKASKEASKADIFIEPDTGKYANFDFDAIEEFIDLGRFAAKEKLDAIKVAVDQVLETDTNI